MGWDDILWVIGYVLTVVLILFARRYSKIAKDGSRKFRGITLNYLNGRQTRDYRPDEMVVFWTVAVIGVGVVAWFVSARL